MRPNDAIFLLGGDGALERVPLQPYSTEDVLQKLIAQYPELLASEQIDPDDPPRWLLVTREAGIPDTETSSDRWSADHLLLDQNACPTIVEVKRSSDTRIRREIIGQMLDYAANAIAYWPLDRIRLLAANTCGGTDKLEDRIRELLRLDGSEASAEVENYWRKVDSNLRSGEVRLLFVADDLPRELRRVIEFLNENMPRIEVLGVEVRQFSGKNVQALVPRVIGQTERARQEKVTASQRKTSRKEFLESCPAWSRAFYEDLFDGVTKEGFQIYWGTKGFSVRATKLDGELVSILYGYPPGSSGGPTPSIELYLKYLMPFEDPKAISRALKEIAPFQESGQYTIKLLLEPQNLASGREALKVIWKLGHKITTFGVMR